MFQILLGIAVVCLALLAFRHYLHHISRSRTSRYMARVTDNDRLIIHRLVSEVAPTLGDWDPTRADLAKAIGVASVHPEIYYRFKTLREKGLLSETRLIQELESGGDWLVS